MCISSCFELQIHSLSFSLIYKPGVMERFTFIQDNIPCSLLKLPACLPLYTQFLSWFNWANRWPQSPSTYTSLSVKKTLTSKVFVALKLCVLFVLQMNQNRKYFFPTRRVSKWMSYFLLISHQLPSGGKKQFHFSLNKSLV